MNKEKSHLRWKLRDGEDFTPCTDGISSPAS
jgi:hypothetical protein